MGRDDSSILRLSEALRDADIGKRQDDGTIFAGNSPDTKKPLFIRPQDKSLTMKWREAMEYAANFEGHGRAIGAFRLSTPREMRMILDNHEKIPGLKITSQFKGEENYYWTSQRPPSDCHGGYETAWAEHFMEQFSGYWPIYDKSSVRLVCDELK